jgi:two-component system phosphate regulon sensor histidine kinase PhoR
LGLAFCKEITEFIGGDITVKSQLGQGTTFTLVFPV